ncbi:hypothetical protein BT63DRAFT_449854 [Microthyrium microscopicum]|uniref:Uncharacterized protein n=1 Tax=Microthyrium microscopicum TaxID=703497 RepID=A0A6A6URF4_9PEZI|nr:hypothetical protein BT63DRAFT_449854 [Microthyrium microscopicum]
MTEEHPQSKQSKGSAIGDTINSGDEPSHQDGHNVQAPIAQDTDIKEQAQNSNSSEQSVAANDPAMPPTVFGPMPLPTFDPTIEILIVNLRKKIDKAVAAIALAESTGQGVATSYQGNLDEHGNFPDDMPMREVTAILDAEKHGTPNPTSVYGKSTNYLQSHFRTIRTLLDGCNPTFRFEVLDVLMGEIDNEVREMTGRKLA